MCERDEPPIREFADRGTIWLLESTANLRDLITMAASEIAARLAFDRAERVNRSFVPADLREQEADLLFRVPFVEGDTEVWVYVLVEHQSRPDPMMGLRVLSYMVQIWEMQRRRWKDEGASVSTRKLSPIIPMVFYTGRRQWSGVPGIQTVMDAPPELARFVPRHETLYLALNKASDGALMGTALGAVLRVVRYVAAPTAEMERALVEAVKLLEDLPPGAQAEWRRAVQYLVLLIRHTRPPGERRGLYGAVEDAVSPVRREELRQMAKTDAQRLLDQGRKLGREEGRAEARQEGRQEGRQEAYAAILATMLERRFGSLSATQRQSVAALSDTAAIEMGLRLLDARSIADLGL